MKPKKKKKKGKHNLYKKLVLLQNPLIKESLKNKEFATQYFLDLHQQFQKYNAKNPNAPLDSHIILTCFYNQYCQTRLMNILLSLIQMVRLPSRLTKERRFRLPTIQTGPSHRKRMKISIK